MRRKRRWRLRARGGRRLRLCHAGALQCAPFRSAVRARSCLIGAGVARVVVACEDPHAMAAHGISRLGAAGVEVMLGLMRAEAEALNAGFFKVVRTGRPWLAIDGDPADL